MAKTKKKLLPKDFEARLEKDNVAELIAIFDTCDVNARGGYSKVTALAFDKCPDELVRWLVAHGADLSAVDSYGNTPLHTRARSGRSRIDVLLELGANVHDAQSSIGTPLHAAAHSHNDKNARLLLNAGADANARNRDGLTPLELALKTCSNIDIERMVPLARHLLNAGQKTQSL